jgi:hypothetical protein
VWYYADAGPALGLVMYGETRATIGVLEAPGDASPVGLACCAGWDAGGLAVWRLVVRGAELRGRWIIVDREFRPAG